MHVRNLTSMLRPEHHARKVPGSRADHMQQGASFVRDCCLQICMLMLFQSTGVVVQVVRKGSLMIKLRSCERLLWLC